MNTIRLIIITFALGCLLAGCATEKSARNKLLENTPVGTSFDSVLAYCKQVKLNCKSSSMAGYYNQTTGKAVGVKSIRSTLYEYHPFPLVTTTFEANWGFDADGKLIDIWVWSTSDSL